MCDARVTTWMPTYMLSELRVEEIADRLHLDRRYLSRIFKEKTGETLQEYIVSTRMAVAKKALLEGLSVASTAERCGYTDVFVFSKMFKRRFGISPAHWKKQNAATIANWVRNCSCLHLLTKLLASRCSIQKALYCATTWKHSGVNCMQKQGMKKFALL